MKDAGFVHLHNHTEYSLLDGAARIKPLAQLAADYRLPALAITDHGNLFGAIEFYKAVQAVGVKPIIGCEVYVAPRSMTEKTVHPEIPESSFHLTLLCETLEGYHNLMQLASAGYLEGFYYRPRIDKELLQRHRKGLIALSACLKGEVNYYLNRGEFEKAQAVAAELQEIMGRGNFLLEVMRIGLPECAKVEAGAEAISRELGIAVVATNDSHYLRRTDHEAHDALLCLQTGKRVKDKARLKFGTSEVYLKSPDEMASLFSDKPEYLRKTLEIADRCNVLLEAQGRQFALPVYPRPEDAASDFDYLSKQAWAGLEQRCPAPSDPARERLTRELGVIGKMGFSGYFLIVKDIVDYARSQAIPVGPGRGSAVGSLVLYALGITDVDPLRYGLIFERFLTPERVSLPDIDVDFADTRRAEVIAYIRRRYGENSVAQIITFGTMQSRGAVRDVGRVLDVPLAEVDRLAKMIPFDASLPAALKQNRELDALVKSRPDYQKVFEIAQRLEGVARHASIHASGVVITPRPLIESVPLYRSSEGDICTQYDMNALEAIGLLKMDILGLRTLSVVDACEKLLKGQSLEFDRERVPQDDAKTFDLLKRADVVGVFQLESGGMQNLLLRTQPENLEDIMAVISLHRPGPMGNVDLDEYIRRKKGLGGRKSLHPAMDEVLADTHGVIVYQEQVMKVAHLVAGFSLAEADKLRRVMGKKVAEEMVPMREKFLAGAKKQHVAPKVANAIFDLIEPFAGYGFNKSHAAGYAMLSYLTAYLKANFPVEFLAATLTSEMGNSEKLRKFVTEVRRMGLTLLGPDINASDYPFTIEAVTLRAVAQPHSEPPGVQEFRSSGVQEFNSSTLQLPNSGERRDTKNEPREFRSPGVQEFRSSTPQLSNSPTLGSEGTPRIENDQELRTRNQELSLPSPRAIRFGLGGIKNLGQGVCEGIVRERIDQPYASFSDFIKRTRGFVHRKACESLIMAGALDSITPDRQELMNLLPAELEKASSARAAMRDRQVSLFGSEPAASSAADARASGAAGTQGVAPSQPGSTPTDGRNESEAVADAARQSSLATGDSNVHHTYEKSAFGFYLSSHPLEEFRYELEVLKCCPLENLAERDRTENLAVAGVITEKKTRKDKNGRDYAILQLEDLTGSAEVMVFSNALEAYRKLLKSDELVIVLGKMRSRGEGQVSVWADALISLKDARSYLKTLTIRLRDPEPDEADLFQIRKVLEAYPGSAEVFFQVREQESDRVIRVRDLRVLPSTQLIRQLRALPLVQDTKLTGALPIR
jgi:DNA polymerase-3 subunit alpha